MNMEEKNKVANRMAPFHRALQWGESAIGDLRLALEMGPLKLVVQVGMDLIGIDLSRRLEI